MRESIQRQLNHIPENHVEIIPHYPNRGQHAPFSSSEHRIADGKGMVDDFHLFHGLHLSHYRFLAHRLQDHHPASDTVFEINHCYRGRVGWQMRDGGAVYLGPGDMDIHTTFCCADSIMEFPLGYYEGIAISIDVNRFAEDLPTFLKDAGFSRHQLFDDFCDSDVPLTLPSGSPLDRMLEALYRIPEKIRLPYYQLKVLEILLLFSVWKPGESGGKERNSDAEKTKRMKEIHAFLTENLEERHTVEELSKKFHINTTSLKEEFKAVYGAPIASYMKEYRMREAVRLMEETDWSLSHIAQRVGYASQSKFTKAFKEVMQALPGAFRKEGSPFRQRVRESR